MASTPNSALSLPIAAFRASVANPHSKGEDFSLSSINFLDNSVANIITINEIIIMIEVIIIMLIIIYLVLYKLL